MVRCHPWTPPSGKLADDHARQLIAAIGQGTSAGPYSPYLGKGNRSLSPLLDALGISGDRAQRLALRDLKDRYGVVMMKFKRPGHGGHERAGLRTASGAPFNYEWSEAGYA